jgi:hypothetical protein
VIFNTASGKPFYLLYKLALYYRRIIPQKTGKKEKTKNERKMSEFEKTPILRKSKKYHKVNE